MARKSMLRLSALVAGLALAAVGLPLLLDAERLTLDDAARSAAPGRFAELPVGTTHYRIWGEAGNPAVLLIHGFNGPLATWDHTAPTLAAAGYRVIGYDLIGRGWSDRPRLDYTLDAFVEQLDQLLQALGHDEPLRLVASSFGSVVATAWALREPARARGIAMLGPAGFPATSQRSKWLLGIPVFSDWLYRVIGDRLMARITRAYYVQPERFPEAHAAFAQQTRYRGFKRAALSTLRHAPLHDYSAGWQALGRTEVPVLLVWGREDVSFPYRNHALAQQWMPQARLVTVDRSAHLPQYERPEAVNPALTDWLGSLP